MVSSKCFSFLRFIKSVLTHLEYQTLAKLIHNNLPVAVLKKSHCVHLYQVYFDNIRRHFSFSALKLLKVWVELLNWSNKPSSSHLFFYLFSLTLKMQTIKSVEFGLPRNYLLHITRICKNMIIELDCEDTISGIA